MKTEQEIVLQKKIIIIFSLVILTVTMGILNIQKEKLNFANCTEEEDSITKVYTVYTANEELFKIEESGDILLNVEEFLSGEEEKQEVNDEIIVAYNNVEEKTSEVDSNVNEPVIDEVVEEVKDEEPIKVASRGSYVRDTSVPPTEYQKVIQVKATAYCLCKKCCGKSPDNPRYGYTASGIRIVPGTGMKVIAVDTSVVPLGTNVYVEGLNGAGNYGYAIAADTGSAIKNNKIDLYMDTHEQALAWGVKTVNLYILGE